MKKCKALFVFWLVLTLCIGFVGCSNSAEKINDEKTGEIAKNEKSPSSTTSSNSSNDKKEQNGAGANSTDSLAKTDGEKDWSEYYEVSEYNGEFYVRFLKEEEISDEEIEEFLRSDDFYKIEGTLEDYFMPCDDDFEVPAFTGKTTLAHVL